MSWIKAQRKVAVDGFTLIETLVLITITAVVAMAVMNVNAISHRTPNLTKQAEMVSQLASFARLQARSKRKVVAVNVDLEDNIISIVGYKKNEIKLPSTTSVSLVTGLELVRNEMTGSIVFFAAGGATGGEITLSSTEGNTMPKTIKINWLTGAVITSEAVDENNVSH